MSLLIDRATGGPKRKRQADKVRQIAAGLVADGKNVIVLGDFDEGQPALDQPAAHLAALFDPAGPLPSCYDLPGFDAGPRPGTDSCGIRNRLDYILLSNLLRPAFVDGQVYRKGLCGSRKTRPTQWEIYSEMLFATNQASDHAAIKIHLDL